MRLSIRRLFASVHRWTGLTLGLLIGASALTGAAMAWRTHLEPLIDSRLNGVEPCASPLPLDELLTRAKAAHADVPATFIKIEPGTSKAAIVRFRDNDDVFVDSCSGQVRGEEDRYGGLFGRLEQLHKLAYWTKAGWNRLIPNVPTNTLIMGTSATVFATMLILGGLFLWWPRHPRTWRSAVTIDSRLRGRAFVYKLHSTAGVWVSLIALTSAVTGMTWAFSWPHAALSSLTASPMPKGKFASALPPTKDAARLSAEAAWMKARTIMPDVVVATIYPPSKAEDPIRIRAVERSSPHGEAVSTLYLDAYLGTVLSFQPYRTLGMGTKLFYWARAVHTGRTGGAPVQLLLTIGALGILISIYAGFSSYFRKVFSRRRAASPATEREPRRPRVELEGQLRESPE